MATLVQQVDDLKKENKALKMKVTKMENQNGAKVKAALKDADKKIADLGMQLEASEERADNLADQIVADQGENAELRKQIYHYQQLLINTAAVTVWKELP